MVACWGALNVLVLFLVCMLCLQARVRRSEERFNIDEPIWLFEPSGALLMGRTKDMSLSGAGVIANVAGTRNLHLGNEIRVFIAEVGFVNATVTRQSGEILGIRFKLPLSFERDLLIRKLFTAGLDMTIAAPSARSVTAALLRSVWATRTGVEASSEQAIPETIANMPAPTLPLETLRIAPRPTAGWAETAQGRARAA